LLNLFVLFDKIFFFNRIYSAFIKTVDEQAKISNWGKITNTELLHEFQSGLISKIFLLKNFIMINLESGWIHDVTFSPLGDNLAWVSHNSIIFAVSANNLSRFV